MSISHIRHAALQPKQSMTNSQAKWLTEQQDQKLVGFSGMIFVALLTWDVQDHSMHSTFAQLLHKPKLAMLAAGCKHSILRLGCAKKHVESSLLTGLLCEVSFSTRKFAHLFQHTLHLAMWYFALYSPQVCHVRASLPVNALQALSGSSSAGFLLELPP